VNGVVKYNQSGTHLENETTKYLTDYGMLLNGQQNTHMVLDVTIE
jgi:hypothetical protein